MGRSHPFRRGIVSKAAVLRADAQELRDKLVDVQTPEIRHQAQILIDELEAEARSLGNGDAILT
jgi:hypothetical protein